MGLGIFFFFNDTATTEIYTLSLHDALPIWRRALPRRSEGVVVETMADAASHRWEPRPRPRDRTGRVSIQVGPPRHLSQDRKSTRLNSSHANISYAVFCLKKKKTKTHLSTII